MSRFFIKFLRLKKILLRMLIFPTVGMGILFLMVTGVQNFIRYNPTISEKVGWYLILPVQQIDYNQLYTISITDEYVKLIRNFGYEVSDGSLLKRVVAKSGDEVIVGSDGIFINGVLLSKSKVIVDNIKLHSIPVGFKKVLQDDEYWVMGETATSLDSRYFGIVKRSQFLKQAYFLF